MSSISIFESRIREFIQLRKKIHISRAEDNLHMGKWGDKAWGQTPARYRFVRTFSGEKCKKRIQEANIVERDLIPNYYRDFLKSYLSYLCLEKAKRSYALSDVTYAFRDLADILDSHDLLLSDLSLVHLKKFERQIERNFSNYALESRGAAISALIKFMTKQNMLSNSISYPNPFTRKDTAGSVTESRNKKLPELAVLNAIAEIYAKIMHDCENAKCRDRETTIDRIACAQTSLLFGAPSRIGELTLLGTNPITSIQTDDSETYALRWRGSKGMVDHEKHIHADMFPTIKRSVDYLDTIGQEARVLARFYENPSMARRKLFEGFHTKKLPFPDVENNISLWELAGELKLFDQNELLKLKETRRWPKSEKNSDLLKHESTAVSFGDLCPDFPFGVDPKVVVSHQIARNIFNLGGLTNLPFLPKGHFITMGELQIKWISYMRKSIPSFPYIYQGVLGKKVKYSHALFLVRGNQVPHQSAMFSFGASRFAIQNSATNVLVKS